MREHIAHYGHGIEDRLTGAHETARFDKFSYGTSNRAASIRIPWGTAKERRGWLEDRRPNANMDPYVVSRLMVETVCSAAEAKGHGAGKRNGKATATATAARKRPTKTTTTRAAARTKKATTKRAAAAR